MNIHNKIDIISHYTFSIKDIIYCICDIINDRAILCKLAQINKLFCNVVLTLPYYKSCKQCYTEDKNNKQIWKETVIKYGNLRLLKFLSPNINKEYNEVHDMFINSCKFGQLPISKWLVSYAILINFPVNIHANNEGAFQLACGNDHLETAKWLIDYGKSINSPINIHVNDEGAFRWACNNGHLEIIKWLVNYGKIINSPINNEDAFRWTCGTDHLETAKWLLEYSKVIGFPIDIHANNDWIFRNSPKHIIDWLNTL